MAETLHSGLTQSREDSDEALEFREAPVGQHSPLV